LKENKNIHHLAIVPVDDLILHEYHDEQRTPSLVEKFQVSGVLKNPPVVLPLKSQTGGFIVLDGANRVSAFRKTGIPHILVQIVNEDDPNLAMNSWNHILWGIPPDDLVAALKKIPGIRLQPSTKALSFRHLMDIHSLVSIHLPNGDVFSVVTSCVDLIDRIEQLNKIVACYFKITKVDRTSGYQLSTFLGLYRDLSALILFHPFRLTEVIDVVEAGRLMPPGSTRFSISPRVLHVNYALSKLKAEGSLTEKNQDLQDWISARMTQKKVRFYEEPTILYDE